jgi:hypothetical protein
MAYNLKEQGRKKVGGGTRWRPKPFSPPLVATFGPRPASFQKKNPHICGERWRILRKRWSILEKIGGLEAN